MKQKVIIIREEVREVNVRKMHWLYFLLLGLGMGSIIVCMIFPLFFKGGRTLAARLYGYW